MTGNSGSVSSLSCSFPVSDGRYAGSRDQGFTERRLFSLGPQPHQNCAQPLSIPFFFFARFGPFFTPLKAENVLPLSCLWSSPTHSPPPVDMRPGVLKCWLGITAVAQPQWSKSQKTCSFGNRASLKLKCPGGSSQPAAYVQPRIPSSTSLNHFPAALPAA